MPDTLTVRRALAQSSLVPIDAQVLLAHVLKRDRGWLLAHATDPLDPPDAEAFFALARRRRDGEPVAYLTGWREFWGLPLAVDPAVLIPRPETETLVESALRKLPRDRPLRVLDLGTGSGAVGLAIAHERPHALVVATDRSEAALQVAGANARRLGLSNLRFVRSDWFEALSGSKSFDLIASNPPYVAEGDRHLAEGDVRFEPAHALASGADGLDALRTIVGGALDRLVGGGWLAVEHGFDQAAAVRSLLENAGFSSLESSRDLSGIPRVAAGRAR
jgi:release factor glutamine methyltransferase